jgi:hypothetical protein
MDIDECDTEADELGCTRSLLYQARPGRLQLLGREMGGTVLRQTLWPCGSYSRYTILPTITSILVVLVHSCRSPCEAHFDALTKTASTR